MKNAAHDIRASLLFAESIRRADLGFSLNFVLNALVTLLNTAPQIICDGTPPIATSAMPTPTIRALPGMYSQLQYYVHLKLSQAHMLSALLSCLLLVWSI
jgi:hypothetical protein